jgi:hypothetical protein
MPKRIDGNQVEIVQALRDIGATVQSLASIGKGCPDLLVGYQGKNYLFEIKSENGKLTKDEAVWTSKWDGQVRVVCSPEQAIRIVRGGG